VGVITHSNVAVTATVPPGVIGSLEIPIGQQVTMGVANESQPKIQDAVHCHWLKQKMQ